MLSQFGGIGKAFFVHRRGIACKYCVGLTHFNCENQFLFPIVVTGCLTCDPLAD